MSPARRPVVVEAAGALVWRVRLGHLQVALVHRPRYRDWSWPKGKLDPGESALAAATREVAEETGHDVVLGVPLPSLEYPLSDGRLKHVHYWAAQVAGRPDAPALRARPPVPRAPRSEIDAVRWFDVDEAARKLSRGADRAPLDALVHAHAKNRLDTRAVVVLRHGSARRRSTWKGADEDRPLTADGSRQAGAIAPLLSAYGVTNVLTSPWLRCLDTVRPYTEVAQIEPERSDALTEQSHGDSPEKVHFEVMRLLAEPADSLLCTHRPVLPTVFGVLASHARRSVADALPRDDPYLRPSGAVVAHVAQRDSGPRVVAVETHGAAE